MKGSLTMGDFLRKPNAKDLQEKRFTPETTSTQEASSWHCGQGGAHARALHAVVLVFCSSCSNSMNSNSQSIRKKKRNIARNIAEGP